MNLYMNLRRSGSFDASIKGCAAALVVTMSMAAIPANANEPAPEQSAARYETRFLTGMIDHHAMAVMMAQLCGSRATHEELVDLCTSIVESQSSEIATMQTWLTDWYGISYEPDMGPGAERRMEKLAGLTGVDFEIAFLETMIRHHARAVQEASLCVERVWHADLVSLCSSIMETQAAEISMMETWLCDWYGICSATEH